MELARKYFGDDLSDLSDLGDLGDLQLLLHW
jgi:hypothetical protein